MGNIYRGNNYSEAEGGNKRMKFRKVFHLEFAYQVRSVSTWLYFLVLSLIAILFIIGNYIHDARDGNFMLNAPIVIATVTVFCSLFWLLIGASVAGDAAVRDVQTRMHSLTYTAPVSKAVYLGGRLLAAFVLNALVLLAIPVGILVGMHLTGVEPEILGPFRPAAYLNTYFYIVLPNAFVATAIQFSLATLNRRALASYLGGLLLFIAAYLLGQVLQDSGELGTLVDPIGFSPILSHLTDEWTPLEKNTRLIGLEGAFLMNRLLWMGIALGALTYTYFRFRFTHTEVNKQQKQALQQHTVVNALEWLKWGAAEALPRVKGTFGLATHVRQMRLITWKSFLQLAKSRVGLLLLALIATLVAVAMPGNLDARDVPLLPRTGQVLNYLTAPLTQPGTFWIIITLLTVFYAGELVWWERETGLSEIANATPVQEWVLFLSRFLALSLILVIWTVLLMTGGVLTQITMGISDIVIGLYLQILFGLQLLDYLLFAMLALFVHVVVNQKYIGHLIALLAYGFIAFAANIGIEHKLLVFTASPRWSYTDMAGFGVSLGPWLWFKAYWVAWALLLAVVAKLLWVRGRESSSKSRFKLARRRFTRSTIFVATVAVTCILIFGGFIFYNTNFLNSYQTLSEITEQRAQYEQRYGRYKNIPQPQHTGASLHVEIYPEKRMVGIRGTYLLVNNSTLTIDSVHLSTNPGVDTKAIVFDQPATQVLDDEALGHRIYALNKPLQPGDTLKLNFRVYIQPRGFTNSGADATVLSSGTNFRNYEWLPAIGYQSYRELDDVGVRESLGLAPRPATPSLYDVEARQSAAFAEKVNFEAVVGTDANHVVVAPGTLQRSWTKGSRRYFHYATDAPIRNEYNIFSANYAVHEGRWKDVAIQIYFDPGQTENVERMVQSISASLDYYSSQFGPYPHRQIRFVSYPGYGIGNHAAPINITAEEGFFLMNPKNDPRGFDLVTAVVAHEVAHQWWGNQFKPASVEGAGLLTESLAWYSAMGVLEEKYGSGHLQRLLSFLREENENPRTRAAVPLLQANDWYQNYRKGPFALYALSQYIGKEKVNSALRSLIEKHESGLPPLPTTLDLYRELQATTPDSLQYLLHDLFKENTFWDLETKQTIAKQIKSGTWQVTLEVQAHKFKVDSVGVETKLPINDWVEVGVYAPPKADQDQGEVLYLKKHYLQSAKQKITLTVPGKPSQAGIDPRYLLIDWETNNNFKNLKL